MSQHPSRAARVENWPERLNAAIQGQMADGFAWGQRDCATFFAESVRAQVGFDVLAAHRGWTSAKTALQAVNAAGFETMTEWVDAHFDEIHAVEARRGDLGYTADEHPLMCPAVITGAEALSLEEAGLVVFPRELIVRAFRVGL